MSDDKNKLSTVYVYSCCGVERETALSLSEIKLAIDHGPLCDHCGCPMWFRGTRQKRLVVPNE